MFRLLFYLMGFGFLVIGSVNCIAYLNIITMGNSLYTYFNFIVARPECIVLIIGLLFIGGSVYFQEK